MLTVKLQLFGIKLEMLTAKLQFFGIKLEIIPFKTHNDLLIVSYK